MQIIQPSRATLNKNLATPALAGKFTPDQIGKLNEIINNFRIILDDAESLNIVSLTNNELSIYYPYDVPARSHKILSKQKKWESASHIIVFGFDFFATPAKIIAAKNQAEKIIIIEPRSQVLLTQLSSIDFQEELNDSRIIIITQADAKSAALECVGQIGIAEPSYRSWAMFSPQPEHQEFFHFAKNFVNKFGPAINHKKVLLNTAAKYTSDFIDNYIYNISQSPFAVKPASFRNIYQVNEDERIGLIVASGPSLTKQLKTLAEHREKFIILCCGAALKTLHNNNIHPDFAFIIDPSIEAFNAINSEKLDSEIIITHILANRNIWSLLPVKICLFTGELQTGGSVAHFALSFSQWIGLKKVAFIGQDLALTDNKSHESGHQQYQEINAGTQYNRQKIFDIESYNGGKVPSTDILCTFRHWIEVFISNYAGTQFFNTTEGGAYIDGATHIPFVSLINSTHASTQGVGNVEKLHLVKYSQTDTDKALGEIKQDSLYIQKYSRRYLNLRQEESSDKHTTARYHKLIALILNRLFHNLPKMSKSQFFNTSYNMHLIPLYKFIENDATSLEQLLESIDGIMHNLLMVSNFVLSKIDAAHVHSND